jgi:hypothetical protein
MGRDTAVRTQRPTQLSEEPIWPELSDQVPMDDADASTHPRAFFCFLIFWRPHQRPGSRVFGRTQRWRRVATRRRSCPHQFISTPWFGGANSQRLSGPVAPNFSACETMVNSRYSSYSTSSQSMAFLCSAGASLASQSLLVLWRGSHCGNRCNRVDIDGARFGVMRPGDFNFLTGEWFG